MNAFMLRFLFAAAMSALALACGKPASEQAKAPEAAKAPSAEAAEPAPAPAQAESAQDPDRTVYVCEMGCEVSPEPGKCSKCGMELQEAKLSQIAFTCGQCGYTAKEPGVCPHCKSELTFKRKS